MKQTTGSRFTFKPTELLKEKVSEIIRDAESQNYVQGVKIGRALGGVYAREHARLELKYGEDHPRTEEAKLRSSAGSEARKAMFQRHTDVSTPPADAGTGWAVDGFVRTAGGDPVSNITVAAYDSRDRVHDEFGYGCTDAKGYFKIVASKIPDRQMRVFILASREKKLLKSNENRLTPAAGVSERIDIILERDEKNECSAPPTGKAEAVYYDQKPSDDPIKKDVVETTPSPAQPRKEKTDKANVVVSKPDTKTPPSTIAKSSGSAKPINAKTTSTAKNMRTSKPKPASTAAKRKAVKKPKKNK